MLFIVFIILVLAIGIPLGRAMDRSINNKLTTMITAELEENNFKLVMMRPVKRKEKIPGRFPKHPVGITDFMENTGGTFNGVFVRYIEFKDNNNKQYFTYVQVDNYGFNKTTVSFLPYEKLTEDV